MRLVKKWFVFLVQRQRRQVARKKESVSDDGFDKAFFTLLSFPLRARFLTEACLETSEREPRARLSRLCQAPSRFKRGRKKRRGDKGKKLNVDRLVARLVSLFSLSQREAL